MKREDLLWTLIGLSLLYSYLSNNLSGVLFGVVLFSYIVQARRGFNPDFDVKVDIPERFEEGITGEVVVGVVNRGSEGFLEVEVSGEDVEGDKRRVFLRKGESVVKVKVKPLAKGEMELKFKIRFEDRAGLYYEEEERSFRIQVLPSVDSIREAMEEERRVRLKEAYKKGRIGVESLEIYGLREYLPGDDVRRIDWKASARIGKIIVKEFLRESEGDVYIVLDASREMRKRVRKSKIDYASTLALYLATLIVREGRRVGLIIFWDEDFKVVKPGRELEKIREAIRFRPVRGLMSFKGEISLRVRGFLKLFPRKRRSIADALLSLRESSHLILISDLMSNTPLLYRAIAMAKKKHRIVILSPNPVLFYSGELDEETLRFLYRKYKEREKVIRRFNSLVPTLDLGPSDYREVLEVLG